MTRSEEAIIQAIDEHRLISFVESGYTRIAEPHVLGEFAGSTHCLTYQVRGGSSSGGLPQWRRFNVAEMSNVEIAKDSFVGPRPNPSGAHSSFDRLIKVVRPKKKKD